MYHKPPSHHTSWTSLTFVTLLIGVALFAAIKIHNAEATQILAVLVLYGSMLYWVWTHDSDIGNHDHNT